MTGHRGGSGRGGRGRRASGRSSQDRAHSRPISAATPAASSAARVSAALERLLGGGVRVAAVASALGVRGIDVARWRRGQPVPAYRREDIEAKLQRLTVVTDPVTGLRVLEETPA